MEKINFKGKTPSEKFNIPYKNRWGFWVWRREEDWEDKNWPGITPPSEEVKPELIDNVWYWVKISKEKD